MICWTRCTLLSCCAWCTIGNTCSASVVTQIKLGNFTNSSRSAFSAIANIVRVTLHCKMHFCYMFVLPVLRHFIWVTTLALHVLQIAKHRCTAEVLNNVQLQLIITWDDCKISHDVTCHTWLILNHPSDNLLNTLYIIQKFYLSDNACAACVASCAFFAIGNTCSACVVTQIKLRSTSTNVAEVHSVQLHNLQHYELCTLACDIHNAFYHWDEHA